MTPAVTREDAREKVPTVSLELYAKDFKKFVHDLGEAYERYGFVILENHGIDLELIERAMERSKAFFACDEECKKKYTLRGLGGARGYTAFGVETAKGANAPGAWRRCEK
jgi:isopenicillin N synthase-like dioxygenase